MKGPLVSIITPFLNAGEWLSEAICSVLDQSYPNWELILIDDGSREPDTAIALRFASRFPDRIRYTDHPGHDNLGVTVSRNRGIDLSKGEYIAFLDADDTWMPHKLDHQLAIFEKHPPAGMVCEASLFWYSWLEPSREDHITPVGANANVLYDPESLLSILYPLGDGAPPCPTGIMITREAFERSGGFEPAFTGDNQLYEDQAFLCKIYLRERVYVSGEAQNRYRKRKGSLTDSVNDSVAYRRRRLFFLRWLEDYLLRQFPQGHSLVELTRRRLGELDDGSAD